MLKTKNQTTNDVFRGKNARNHVRVMFLEVQMRKLMLDLLFKSLNGNKKKHDSGCQQLYDVMEAWSDVFKG